MTKNPAILISDELIHLLEDKAITKAYFYDLAGNHYPWDVDLRRIKDIRRQLVQYEKQVRSAIPWQEITCILAGKGAFWLSRDGMDEFYENLNEPVQKLKVTGPMPVWKMTSSELLFSHLSNLKQMILAVAYDLILLHHLKDRLGSSHDFIRREFENSELSIRTLLDDFQKQKSNLEFVTQEEIVLVERCRITMDMLEYEETTEQELGYTQDDLMRVMRVLDKKCKEEMPSYAKKIYSVNSQIKKSLREGESSSLTRASRWKMTFTMLDDLPRSLKGQETLSDLEYDGMKSIVLSRENELGQSESGQQALQASEQAETLPPEPQLVPEEEHQSEFEPHEHFQPHTPQSRMAYLLRRRE